MPMLVADRYNASGRPVASAIEEALAAVNKVHGPGAVMAGSSGYHGHWVVCRGADGGDDYYYSR